MCAQWKPLLIISKCDAMMKVDCKIVVEWYKCKLKIKITTPFLPTYFNIFNGLKWTLQFSTNKLRFKLSRISTLNLILFALPNL